MEEFTFGSLATDELKLIHHRAARRGLQHQWDLQPQDPEPGQPVTLTVTAGPDIKADQVACYYTVDGSEPAGSRGQAINGYLLNFDLSETFWDTLVWGYLQKWQGTLPAQAEGTTLRYRISAWSKDGKEILADWPNVKDASDQATDAYFRGEPLPDTPLGDPSLGRTFAYGVDRLGPPAWAWEAVIYQVFVDRFNPGRGRDWLQTGDLGGIYGGTLWGVAEKMDYIADLGANCIWLTPIFASETHHGYDATDLTRVEPRLGGDEALRAVVAEAKVHGVRVLLDFVCNHVSNQHPIFLDAQANPSSPYRNWFTFDDSKNGYRSYFGVPTMPEVNLRNPEARRWMIDIARYWMREFQVDGYRLDHANGPGPDFWTDFWAACKDENPESLCFGEVVDAPSAQQAYIGRLDGCLDFHLGDALRRTFALKIWTEEDFERFLARHRRFFPENFLMPTFIDNHDMDRFIFIAGGDKEALRRAAQVQMQLPGPPIIYYGTEVGLNQTLGMRDGHGMHVNRVPMIWGEEQDRELLTFYQDLIQERKRSRTDVKAHLGIPVS